MVKTVLLKWNCIISTVNENMAFFFESQGTEMLLLESHYAACYNTVRITDFDRENSM